MAWQDGSFGWTGIANLPSSFAAATYLPAQGFAEVFTANDNRVTMGVGVEAIHRFVSERKGASS